MSTVEAARIAGIDPARGAPVRRQHAARSARVRDGGRRGAGVRRDPALSARRLPGAARCDRGVRRRRSRRGSCSARAPTTSCCSCARAFAGPGDVVRVLDEPTYPLFRIAAWLAGAEVGDEGAVVTFCCRPHNPTGALGPIPAGAAARRRRGVLRVRRRHRGRARGRRGDPDLLEGVRPRCRARRLRDRGRGRRVGARRPPGPAPDHDALRGARARGAAGGAARRERDAGRAPAARGRARASSASRRCRRTRTSSTCRPRARRLSTSGCSRRGSSSVRSTARSASPSTCRPRTTGC